jgi:hypothetical protein
MVVGAIVFSNPPMLGLIKPQPMLEGGRGERMVAWEKLRGRGQRVDAAFTHFTEKKLVDNRHPKSRKCRDRIHKTNYDENLRFKAD